MLVKTVDTILTTNTAGQVVESIPVLPSEDPVQRADGSWVDPIDMVEDEQGVPIRIVDDAIVNNSIGQPVAAIPGKGLNTVRIELSATSVPENAAIGDAIGALSVANGSGSYTFTITSDPDSKFSIDGNDLEVAAALDYDTATSHSVTIEADNGVDDPISRTFTISVTNVLEVTLSTLMIDDDEAEPGVAWSATITGKSSGSTIAATSSDGTILSVVGSTVSGTFAAVGTPDITLTETHPDATNSPNDTVIGVTVSDAVAPDAPTVGQWTVADAEIGGTIDIDASAGTLNGATLIRVEYRIDGGSAQVGAVASAFPVSFSVNMLSDDVEIDVEIRWVTNGGTSDWSDVKAVTPTEAASVSFSTIFAGPENGWLWDPSDITKLFTDSARTAPVVASGDRVGGWTDSSGKNTHITQSTSGLRGTYDVTSGRKSVKSDFGGEFLSTPSDVDLSAGPVLTIIMALSEVDLGSGPYLQVSDSSGSNAQPSAEIYRVFSGTGDGRFNFDLYGNVVSTFENRLQADNPESTGSGERYVLRVRYDFSEDAADEVQAWINGGAVSPTGGSNQTRENTNASYGTTRRIGLLGRVAGSTTIGGVNCYLGFGINRDLTSEEIAFVEAEAAARIA